MTYISQESKIWDFKIFRSLVLSFQIGKNYIDIMLFSTQMAIHIGHHFNFLGIIFTRKVMYCKATIIIEMWFFCLTIVLLPKNSIFPIKFNFEFYPDLIIPTYKGINFMEKFFSIDRIVKLTLLRRKKMKNRLIKLTTYGFFTDIFNNSRIICINPMLNFVVNFEKVTFFILALFLNVILFSMPYLLFLFN